MSNQDLDGKVPANEPFGAPAGPAGTPESLEQQLARERDARTQMRDRLRHTEALAAESHALRARMAQELERVTADRDRLRTAAANAPVVGAPAVAAPAASAEPRFTPRMATRTDDWTPMQPAPPTRRGPWRALAMLGGLAAGIAAIAWVSGTLPGESRTDVAAASAATRSHVVSTPAPTVAAARTSPSAPALALETTTAPSATTLPPSPGAVALPPLTPEQQLAAAPTAAGPATVPAPAPAAASAPVGVAARLRAALDGEGIPAPVEVDAATGHVLVADQHADAPSRDRTDLIIRAVYAGASLSEPQIEHRWLSPKRGEHAMPAAAAAPTAAQAASLSAAAAYAARHAAAEHAAELHKKPAGATVADAEELRPVLPEGRVTAGCRASLSTRSAPHRADMTACMKSSCCSTSARHQAEDCRAYEKAYPFTCSAG